MSPVHPRRFALPATVAARAVALMAVVVAGALAGCSSGEEDRTTPTAEVSGTSSSSDTVPGVVSDLVGEGEQVCADEEGDLSQAADTQVAPAVPQPGLDLLEARALLDDERLAVTFSVVGPIRTAQEPEFVLFIGLVDDLNGFEVRVAPDPDGVWVTSLLTRGVGVNEPAVLPTAEVSVTEATVEVVVSRDQLPDIGPNQPVVYGSSGLVMDEAGVILDRRGEPVDTSAQPARAFEECLAFGQ